MKDVRHAPNKLKLLMIDIETTPASGYFWGTHKQEISVEQIITPTSVLCFAAKWYGSDEITYVRSEKQSGREFDKMIRKAHAMLSEADAICHFNGNSFDIPRLNTEFLRLGLPPPPPSIQIDLLRVAQNKFGMLCHKLAFIAPLLKIGSKVKHAGWSLWIGCMNGIKEDWETMERYNREDVLLLERLYKRLLPWIEGHPNMAFFTTGGDDRLPVCPNCGSQELKSNGLRRASTFSYRRFQCTNCGTWSRERLSLKSAPTPKVR